jgi:cellulose synthase/poly-beta-1,6-N-acetylglucosamine synthase-like glycosyltransferase
LDADFESNISSFLCQDYPSYQVIFTVASADDPAYHALRNHLQKVSDNKQNEVAEAVGPQLGTTASGASRDRKKGGVQTALVIAGYSDSRGEKVHNLLQGLKTVDAKAPVLAFGDIDGRPGKDWLRSLVAPLQDPTVTVSTGFRWELPGSGFVSHLGTSLSAFVATSRAEQANNFVWGGAMAIRTLDFARLAVAERYWANSTSDDTALTRAVYDAGGRVRFEPRCAVASRVESTWGAFLTKKIRHSISTRIYLPGLWWEAAITNGYYCGTVLFGLILLALPGISAGQRLLIAGILLATQLLVMGKGLIHLTIAKELFPEETSSLNSYRSCYWRLSPLVPWVTLINILVSSVSRRFKWGGTQYEVRGRNGTRVLRREKQRSQM